MRPFRRLATLPALALLLLPNGCGRAPDPAASVADSPCEALRSEVSGGRLESALAARDEAVHGRISDCFAQALAEGAVEDAAAWREVLGAHFEGAVLRRGRRLGARAVDEALAETARKAARDRLEAPTPSVEAALSALDVLRGLPSRPEDPGLGRWVRAKTQADLPGELAPHDGPRVVLYVDDFQLGESLLADVAARWARLEGLRVGIVPIRRGFVREGLRRRSAVPASEHASLARRALEGGLALEPGTLDEAEAAGGLGLGPEDGAIVVLSREGRIVGRRSARILDPRPLTPWVERAASR